MFSSHFDTPFRLVFLETYTHLIPNKDNDLANSFEKALKTISWTVPKIQDLVQEVFRKWKARKRWYNNVYGLSFFI